MAILVEARRRPIAPQSRHCCWPSQETDRWTRSKPRARISSVCQGGTGVTSAPAPCSRASASCASKHPVERVHDDGPSWSPDDAPCESAGLSPVTDPEGPRPSRKPTAHVPKPTWPAAASDLRSGWPPSGSTRSRSSFILPLSRVRGSVSTRALLAMCTAMRLIFATLLCLFAVLSSVLAQSPGEEAETELDHRGWHRGAGGRHSNPLGELLPVPLQLPEIVTEKLSAEPCCSTFHQAAPIAPLSCPRWWRSPSPTASQTWPWVPAHPSGGTQAYRQKFEVQFPMMIDTQRARTLRGTPVHAKGHHCGAEGWRMDRDLGFVPWFEGAEKLLQIQLNPQDPFSAFKTNHYMGPTVCAACHRSEANPTPTHHTIAYATLYSRDRVGEEECVRCHVTGLNEGGFEMETTTDFASVSCESCHGPRGPHDGVRLEPKESCEGCHDAQHSIALPTRRGFRFSTIQADHMSESEIRERWAALQSGEARSCSWPFLRPVGHQACQQCHTSEHARWSSGPHAHSEVRLKDRRPPRIRTACPATAPPRPLDSGRSTGLHWALV